MMKTRPCANNASNRYNCVKGYFSRLSNYF
jgi:hypothetical protein